MSLNHTLDHVLLSFPCPNCGFGHERLGSWFLKVSNPCCEGCAQGSHIAYADKVTMFERAAAKG